MIDAWQSSNPAELVVVIRFVIDSDEAVAFTSSAQSVADVLAVRDGCTEVAVCRSTDDRGHWLISTRWASVGQYRRAMSAIDVRAQCIPFFGSAVDELTVYEVLYQRNGEQAVVSTSARADDDLSAEATGGAP